MITQQRLREVLDYNPESGLFVWKVRSNQRVRAGEIAGAPTNKYGHVRIAIDRVDYMAHRLAWFYMTGVWPRGDVDHANQKPADNRWVNLREATRSENCANRGPPSSNTSGYKGISWHKPTKKWQAKIGVNGQRRYLGLFATPEKAYAAYLSAARETFGEYFREA